MRKFFYARLAASNLRKNARTYGPYLLAGAATAAMYYIMVAIGSDPGAGLGMVQFVLQLGMLVVALFAVIFLFYTHSFLIKRRKKEFGLLNILGMEKKHLARVMLLETVYCAGISVGGGLIAGMLLAKLMRLALQKMLRFPLEFTMDISLPGILATLLLFGLIYLGTLVMSLLQIHLAQPVELLRGGQVGEREPRTRWLLALVGVLLLGAGYTLSITITEPMAAILLFFLAVILVILGTYCLFTAGSVALLKLLRKNKGYYYKTSHFISVSGLIYRMKQNAVGLANICILSTMVLVMLSSTVSLYIGAEDGLRSRYPNEIGVQVGAGDTAANAAVDTLVPDMLAAHGLTPESTIDYRHVSFAVFMEGDRASASEAGTYIPGELVNLCVIPEADYCRSTGAALTLGPGEAFISGNRGTYAHDTLTIGDRAYSVRPFSDDAPAFRIGGGYNAEVIGTYFLVVPNMADVEALMAYQEGVYGKNASKVERYVGYDVTGDEAVLIAAGRAVERALIDAEVAFTLESRAAGREDFYSLYGGLLFLGLYLGALFLMATVLILYYKQISEGYDDQERFVIMQKVGLSRQEVKRTIRSQVLLLFFLPLAAACVHIAFAFPMITRLLAMLNLSDVLLYAGCTVSAIALFAVFYTAVYAATAKSYYHIVEA